MKPLLALVSTLPSSTFISLNLLTGHYYLTLLTLAGFFKAHGTESLFSFFYLSIYNVYFADSLFENF